MNPSHCHCNSLPRNADGRATGGRKADSGRRAANRAAPEEYGITGLSISETLICFPDRNPIHAYLPVFS